MDNVAKLTKKLMNASLDKLIEPEIRFHHISGEEVHIIKKKGFW